jgi:hypothetical protein
MIKSKIDYAANLTTLLSIPNRKSCSRQVVETFLLIISGVMLYSIGNLMQTRAVFFLFSSLLLYQAYTVLKRSSINILYFFRYFLVWVLIFGTSTIWFAYGGEVKVAPWGVQYQTYENTLILIFAGYLSLCGSVLGWFSSFLGNVARISEQPSPYPFSNTRIKYLKFTGITITTAIVALYMYKVGGLLGGGATYANRGRDIGFEFGIFNVIHFTGVSILLLSMYVQKRWSQKLFIFIIASLVLGVLSGSRADFLPQIFILLSPYIIGATFSNATISATTMIKLIAKGSLIVVIGYMAAMYVALWRDGIDLVAVVELLIAKGRGVIINDVYGHPMLYFETGNMMLGGLYSSIIQVQEGITGYLLGQSYFNYLMIAPPAFLGLSRPLGLEWFTDIGDIRMSQGGIFEVAEAYWNFGLVGCLIVSYVISRFMGYLLINGLKRMNVFILMWYMVMGFMGLRAVWYQNFSYFRILTVMLVIFVISKLLFAWYVKSHAKKWKSVDSLQFKAL